MSIKNIILAQNWVLPLAHDLRKGIFKFMEHRTDIEIKCCELNLFLEHMQDWEYDGLIAPLINKTVVKIALKPDIPIVSTYYPTQKFHCPQVDVDPEQTAILAADFLSQRNYLHFVVIFTAKREHEQICATHFVDHIKRQGNNQVQILKTENNMPPDALMDWLKTTSKPAAVFCTNDQLSKETCTIIQQNGFLVPDEIGVLSCGNDEMLNTSGGTSISSIRIPHEKIGFEAARIIANLLDGKEVVRHPILYPPIEVVERLSTATRFHDDHNLNQARSFIRQYAASGISVTDVAEHAGVSLRILQKRFKNNLGYSPAQAIQFSRIEIAKNLLSTTHLPMDEIATRSGFPSANYMGKVFRTRIGQSPRNYRKEFAVGGEATHSKE